MAKSKKKGKKSSAKKKPPRVPAKKKAKKATKKRTKKASKKEGDAGGGKGTKKEICDYYAEHGWRKTISKFKVSPTELSGITKSIRKEADKKKAEEKAAKKKARADKKKAKTTKKKATKKRGRKKKEDAAPPKRRGRPPKSDKKAPGKKRGRPPKSATPATPVTVDAEKFESQVLTYLLDYRKRKQSAGGMVPLDSVIIELTEQVLKSA